jgi:hypothetical protein
MSSRAHHIARGFASARLRLGDYEVRRQKRTRRKIKSTPTPESPTRPRPIVVLWPWAFLAFAGVITIAWAIALCWAAFALVRWLID